MHYFLDDNASRFTVRAFATGMLSMMGHSPTIAIRKFSGEADYDPAAPAQASLRMIICADSLEVTDEISSKDRKEIESTMNEKVLEVSKYPEGCFRSQGGPRTSQNRITMNGSLTLHGETQRLPVTAQVNLLGDMLRMTGEFFHSAERLQYSPGQCGGRSLEVEG